jgi:hypothetical protein
VRGDVQFFGCQRSSSVQQSLEHWDQVLVLLYASCQYVLKKILQPVRNFIETSSKSFNVSAIAVLVQDLYDKLSPQEDTTSPFLNFRYIPSISFPFPTSSFRTNIDMSSSCPS